MVGIGRRDGVRRGVRTVGAQDRGIEHLREVTHDLEFGIVRDGDEIIGNPIHPFSDDRIQLKVAFHHGERGVDTVGFDGAYRRPGGVLELGGDDQ